MKFFKEVLRDFAVGVAVVAVTDAPALFDAGSKEQFAIAFAALARAALKAGFVAIAPRVLALRKR